MKSKHHIVIIGGHLTPALATIDQLKKHHCRITFIGRDTTDRFGSKSKEQTQISKKKIKFISFKAAKLHRKNLLLNIKAVPSLIVSFTKAFLLIKKLKPDVVLSFGGYLSLPIVPAAKLNGACIIIHEQTTVMGISNTILSPLADKVCHSWPTTLKSSPKHIQTGNPIRPEFLQAQPKPTWLKATNKPIMLITGGNQGSKAINDKIISLLPTLTKQFTVVHQTGDTRNKHDYQKANKAKAQLPQDLAHDYLPKTWISAEDMAYLMKHARISISRSGANTISELMISNTPSILIPLPISSRNEQYQNAKMLAQLNPSIVLDQPNLNQLESAIEKLIAKPISSKLQATPNPQNQNASEQLAKVILTCVEK